MTMSPTVTRRSNARHSLRSTGPLPTDRKLLTMMLVGIFLCGSGTTYAVRRLAADHNIVSANNEKTTPSLAAELPVLPPDLDQRITDAFKIEEMAASPQYADPFSNGGSTVVSSSTGNNFQAPPQPVAPIVPDLTTRLTAWQRTCREARSANRICPPRTEAYLLSELAPVGTIQIQGRRKVWFYVNPERMSFNVEIGARFFNARLIDTNSEGAVFTTDAGETKTVTWSHNPDLTVSPSGGRNSSDQSAPESPDAKQDPQSAPGDENATPQERDDNRPAGSARRAPRRTVELDALQEAVRERYQKPMKPLSRFLSMPAFNYARPFDRASAMAVSDSEFTPRVAEERFDGSDAPAKVQTRDANNYLREARYRRASFTYTPIEQEEPPQVAAQTASGNATQTAPAKAKQLNPLCDPTYIGEPISVETSRPLTLSDLVRTINTSFKANIVLDSDIQNLPVNLTFVDAPWNQILRTQLDLNDLDVICNEGNSLVQIAKRSKIAQIEEQKRKAAPIVREVFKLRYLQPTAGGRTDLAGRVQGGASATIQSLDETIREILRAGGDTRAEFRRIPGRNEFLVAATPDQIAEIRRLIERVDRPGYQVLIRALVYNVNEDKLIDVGSQLAAVVGNGSQTNLGGFTSLPNTNQSSNNTGSSGATPTDGRNPGGIPTPGRNFATPSGLQAGAPTGVFGVTTIVGTAQFAYQLTLAQNRGLVNIQSRPFGVVSDGDTFDLVSGTQIPVVTAALAGGSAFSVGQVQFIEASRIARITPQVAELEDGKAGFVTLLIQLENNDIANVLYNGYPGVNRQSLQTVMRLRNNETAVIGGLSTDAVQRNQTKVPGLGDIPGLGWLFKRRFEQQSRSRLYFAIAIEVIDQAQNIQAFPAPADAITAPPPPPAAQRPSPYEVKPRE